jgi:hypothetical protein
VERAHRKTNPDKEPVLSINADLRPISFGSHFRFERFPNAFVDDARLDGIVCGFSHLSGLSVVTMARPHHLGTLHPMREP